MLPARPADTWTGLLGKLATLKETNARVEAELQQQLAAHREKAQMEESQLEQVVAQQRQREDAAAASAAVTVEAEAAAKAPSVQLTPASHHVLNEDSPMAMDAGPISLVSATKLAEPPLIMPDSSPSPDSVLTPFFPPAADPAAVATPAADPAAVTLPPMMVPSRADALHPPSTYHATVASPSLAWAPAELASLRGAYEPPSTAAPALVAAPAPEQTPAPAPEPPSTAAPAPARTPAPAPMPTAQPAPPPPASASCNPSASLSHSQPTPMVDGGRGGSGREGMEEEAFDNATVRSSNAPRALTASDILQEQALTPIKDPQLAKLASKMGVRPPTASLSWLATLCSLLEQIPVGALITDMRMPGLPITFANRAVLELTKRSEAELVGKNCRLLQGQRTEGAAVRIITDALRKAKPVILRITNYTKEGEAFKNVLSLQPVFDSTGEYRFSIGLQANEIAYERDPSRYDKLRKLLPTKFDVVAQPKRLDTKDQLVDEAAQTAQWQASIAKFTRLVWSMDWEGTLERFLTSETLFEPFFKWTLKKDANAAAQLELCYRMVEMHKLELRAEQQEQRAVQLCSRYLGM